MDHFLLRCLASRFMKQQVTAAMMTMPTNRAEETPMTSGMRRRSAAGDRRTGDTLTKREKGAAAFPPGDRTEATRP